MEVIGVVDGPDVQRKAVVVRLFDPVGMILHHADVVVDAGVAQPLAVGGREGAVEIGHLDAFGAEFHELVADELAESDVLDMLLQLVLLDGGQHLFHHAGFVFGRVVVFDFDDEFGRGVLFGLRQILLERGQRLAVAERLRAQRGEIGMLDVVRAVHGAVNDDQHAVLGFVDIALRTENAQILCVAEAREGVVGRALLGVEAAMGNDLRLCAHGRYGEQARCESDDIFHGFQKFSLTANEGITLFAISLRKRRFL